MEPALQEYAEQDAGYRQFCDRYQYVASDPKSRKKYMRWVLDLMREEGERDWLIQTGRKEGRKEGRRETVIEVARKLLKKNQPLEDIVEYTGLTLKEIAALKKEL